MARAYPINSSEDAVTIPGVNDYDLLRFPTEFLEEGVVRGFAVTQRGAGANMSVDVAAGFALIEVTNTNVAHGKTYKTWFEETATTNLSITTADNTNPRKDRVVLRIDVSVDPNAAASNIAVIEVLAGTPAGSPSAPAEPANAITLAIVDVPAGDTSITTGQITDSRTYVQADSSVLADIQRSATAITKTRMVFNDFTEKTIVSGAITVDQVLHTVDTESNAGSDDLDTITAAVGTGEIVHLRADNTARSVVIKHNTGNIRTADGEDFALDDTDKSITLVRKSSTWFELCRGTSSGSADAPRSIYANINDSNDINSGTSYSDFNRSVSIDASLLVQGATFKVRASGTMHGGSNTRIPTLALRLDSNTLLEFADISQANSAENWSLTATIIVRSTGGSGSIQTSGTVCAPHIGTSKAQTTHNTATIDTTSGYTLKLSAKWNASDGTGKSCIVKNIEIEYCVPSATS